MATMTSMALFMASRSFAAIAAVQCLSDRHMDITASTGPGFLSRGMRAFTHTSAGRFVSTIHRI